ncbi:MAG: hypothetical protein Q4F05_09880 [bacterium]|nr:hypothetical protein [bacterium]
MLDNVQRQCKTITTKVEGMQKNCKIPRDYVIPNNKIEIDGKGTLQRLFESYQENKENK